MEKRTILAVVLSMTVIMVFYLIQGILYPPPEFFDTPGEAPAREILPESQPASTQDPVHTVQPSDYTVSPEQRESLAQVPLPGEALQDDDPGVLAPIIVETNLLRVLLSNTGGDIISFQLKEHLDGGEPVNMVLAGTNQPHAFTITFGNRDDLLGGRARPVNANFQVRRPTQYIVEFYQDFVMGSGDSAERFTLTKRYEFVPNEYLFELTVTLDGGHSMRRFDFQGAAYTLSFGPQIGPRFERLDQRNEYRQYLSYSGNRSRTERINTLARDIPNWAAIVGKYFTLIAIPNVNQFEIFFSDQREAGLPSASRMLITRPASSSSRMEDKYLFYLGPKQREVLDTYFNGRNNFNPPLHGYQLADAAKGNTFMSIPPLENLLKWILMVLYRIVPNYGIAIILLTIIVKLLMFPLTRKGSEATLRMQTLAPKIKEIQEKHKDSPQKLNAEMAEFYKKEGYNPLAGCLPMLIQMPIFFAMYNLFNNHFDLRGAMFIPGWIPDLSVPESIFNFAPYQLPIVGWSDIRLLPFIYVASQLLYGKVTQTPDQKGNKQMKLMLYAMPIVFFFVLYDVPSGLLVYWIMSNVLTIVQQIIINKYIVRKKAAIAAAAPVIAPVQKSGKERSNKAPVIPPKKKKK